MKGSLFFCISKDYLPVSWIFVLCLGLFALLVDTIETNTASTFSKVGKRQKYLTAVFLLLLEVYVPKHTQTDTHIHSCALSWIPETILPQYGTIVYLYIRTTQYYKCWSKLHLNVSLLFDFEFMGPFRLYIFTKSEAHRPYVLSLSINKTFITNNKLSDTCHMATVDPKGFWKVMSTHVSCRLAFSSRVHSQ